MAIPLATTTIAVSRVPPDATRDGYDTPPAPVIVATAVPAVIGAPSGSQDITYGDRTVVTFRLNCDPTDLRPGDTVTDEVTGETYRTLWARTRRGLGLDHTEGSLQQVSGAST